MVNKNAQELKIEKDTEYFTLSDKPLYDIFEGILSFSYLNDHLKRLKESEFFKLLEKKTLIKIAFNLKEISLKIGTKIYTEK